MPIVKKDSGGWLKADEAKTGTLYEVLSAKEGEKDDFKGLPKMVLTLEIREGADQVWRVDLNSTSKNNLIDAYGNDTDAWIGKDIRAEVVNQKVGKEFRDILYFTHPAKNLKGEIIT